MGHRGPDRGPEPDYVAHIFVFLHCIDICPLFKLTHSDQTQVTLQLSQSFRFSVKIFSRSVLAGGPEKFFFFIFLYRDPEPAVFSPGDIRLLAHFTIIRSVTFRLHEQRETD